MSSERSSVQCLLLNNRMDTILRLLSAYVDTPTYSRTPFHNVSKVLSEVFDPVADISVSAQGVGIFQGIDDIVDYFLLARSEFNGENFQYVNASAKHIDCISDDVVKIETNELVQFLERGEQDFMQVTNQQTMTFAPNSGLLMNTTGYDATPILEKLTLNFDPRELCDNAIFTCPFPLYPFQSIEECYDSLSILPQVCDVDGGGLLMGNTVSCRSRHLLLSRIDPIRNCPLLNSTSESCIQDDCPMIAAVVQPELYEAKAGFPSWLRIVDIFTVAVIALIPIITFSLYRRGSRRFASLSSKKEARVKGQRMSSSSRLSRRVLSSNRHSLQLRHNAVADEKDNVEVRKDIETAARKDTSAKGMLQQMNFRDEVLPDVLQASDGSTDGDSDSISIESEASLSTTQNQLTSIEVDPCDVEANDAERVISSSTSLQRATANKQSLPAMKIRRLELHWVSKKKRMSSKDTLVVKSDWIVLGGCKLTAIRGTSGSGKSTLIKLLCGFRQSHMEVKCDEISQLPPIGYCSQSPDIWPGQMKVRDILLFSCRLYGSDFKDFDAVFEGLGILSLFDLRFGVLSGGEQQRVHLASSICRTSPTVIFLDEPLASLDSTSALNCLRLLKQLPTNHAYVLVVHQTDAKVAAEFDRTIELDTLTNKVYCTGDLGGSTDDEVRGDETGEHEINREEGSFFCGFKASLTLWHSQFFGLPIIEVATALCSVLGAVAYGLLTRDTFQESPLPAEYGLRIGSYVAFIIMATAIITSFCYSLLFAPRERPLVVNLIAQRSLKASAYTIAVLVRTLFYGFFQSAIWIFLVLFVMGIFDPKAALDLTFNVTFFLAGWSALTFTVAYVSSFVAAHLIMIFICGALFLSGLVAPWAAIPDYLRLVHYPNPSFTTIEACKNYFFAEVLDSECGDLDHFTVCASSDRLVDLLDVQPIYSPVAQAYSVFIIAISSVALWWYLKPERGRLLWQNRKPTSEKN